MLKAKILANMRDFGHKWVNPFCALSGIDDFSAGSKELTALVEEGMIKKQMVTIGTDKFGRDITAYLYQYNGPSSNTSTRHLSVVE